MWAWCCGGRYSWRCVSIITTEVLVQRQWYAGALPEITTYPRLSLKTIVAASQIATSIIQNHHSSNNVVCHCQRGSMFHSRWMNNNLKLYDEWNSQLVGVRESSEKVDLVKAHLKLWQQQISRNIQSFYINISVLNSSVSVKFLPIPRNNSSQGYQVLH